MPHEQWHRKRFPEMVLCVKVDLHREVSGFDSLRFLCVV